MCREHGCTPGRAIRGLFGREGQLNPLKENWLGCSGTFKAFHLRAVSHLMLEFTFILDSKIYIRYVVVFTDWCFKKTLHINQNRAYYYPKPKLSISSKILVWCIAHSSVDFENNVVLKCLVSFFGMYICFARRNSNVQRPCTLLESFSCILEVQRRLFTTSQKDTNEIAMSEHFSPKWEGYQRFGINPEPLFRRWPTTPPIHAGCLYDLFEIKYELHEWFHSPNVMKLLARRSRPRIK